MLISGIFNGSLPNTNFLDPCLTKAITMARQSFITQLKNNIYKKTVQEISLQS